MVVDAGYEEALARQPGGTGRTRRPRRGRPRRDLLHQRQHRPAQGRRAHAPEPVPPRRPQRAHQRHQRRRRHPPPRAALPRERLGHAALPHRSRRDPRHAAPLRRRRGAAPDRGARGDPSVRRPGDGAHAPRPPRRRDPRPVVGPQAASVGGSPVSPAMLRRDRGGVRVHGHLRLRHDRGEPDAHPLARQAGRGTVGRTAGHDRAADRRRRRPRAGRRRRRGALGRRRPSARCAPARTT